MASVDKKILSAAFICVWQLGVPHVQCASKATHFLEACKRKPNKTIPENLHMLTQHIWNLKKKVWLLSSLKVCRLLFNSFIHKIFSGVNASRCNLLLYTAWKYDRSLKCNEDPKKLSQLTSLWKSLIQVSFALPPVKIEM